MTSKQERLRVLEKITTYIINGNFHIGEKIYSENQLSNILGVSRSKVRETLVALEIMGIVESRQGEGTFLKEIDLQSEHNPMSLLVLFQSGSIDHVMQMRRIMETGIASYCGKSVDPEIFSEMKKCVQVMRFTDNPRTLSENDIKLHVLMAKSLNNPIITAFMGILVGYMNFISTNNWLDISNHGDERTAQLLIEQHADIVVAIGEKNCDKTIQAVGDHIDYINQHLNQFADDA